MTVTVTPTVEASNVPPRIRLNVSASAGETTTTVNRVNPDGRTVPVRTADGGPLTLSSGVGLLYDYEPPFGSPVSYTSVESPATVSAQVTLDADRAWLIHPGIPALSTPITIADLTERASAVQRGVFQPLGRRTPVVQSDGARKAPGYLLKVYTQSLTELAAMDTLLWDASVLLLNVPAGKGWGIGAEYVSIGDVTESRAVRTLAYADRMWDLPCTVVDRPVGGSASLRTYADVVVDNATYSTLTTRYATYFDLLAGP